MNCKNCKYSEKYDETNKITCEKLDSSILAVFADCTTFDSDIGVIVKDDFGCKFFEPILINSDSGD